MASAKQQKKKQHLCENKNKSLLNETNNFFKTIFYQNILLKIKIT